MVKCLPEFEYFTVFLKNRNFISKIRRSKVTDYAALRSGCQDRTPSESRKITVSQAALNFLSKCDFYYKKKSKVLNALSLESFGIRWYMCI